MASLSKRITFYKIVLDDGSPSYASLYGKDLAIPRLLTNAKDYFLQKAEATTEEIEALAQIFQAKPILSTKVPLDIRNQHRKFFDLPLH